MVECQKNLAGPDFTSIELGKLHKELHKTKASTLLFHCHWYKILSAFLAFFSRAFQAHLNPNLIVEVALQHGGIISHFEVVETSLTDIFIEPVGATALPDAPSTLSV